MVRLEITNPPTDELGLQLFTFQYGQIRNLQYGDTSRLEISIYIPVWLDQKSRRKPRQIRQLCYLHSSMVRLEIEKASVNQLNIYQFTFQYGQIRN